MMRMPIEQARSRWLVLGRPDDLGRHYEAEASTRQEAERLAGMWSGVIVDRRPRLRWSLGGFSGSARWSGELGLRKKAQDGSPRA